MTTEHQARKPATIYDVAARAGVSHQTVSRLLLGHDGIRPETRERIQVALAELDYRKNVMASNLRNGRTGMISLAIPSLNQPYFAELAQHVIVAARSIGLTVFVETTEGDPDREREIVSGSRASLVDGILYSPLALGSGDLETIDAGSPIVLLGDRILHSQFDHVTMPNAGGARAAVQHLIAQGRTRIAVIGAEHPSDYGAATLRMQGYHEAMRAAGLPTDARLQVVAGQWVRSDGVTATEQLIASGIPFDSIFCFNDALALGALRALQSAGISVPQDVAVVGFDDTEDASYSVPSLTSVTPHTEQLAELAVTLLDRRIKGMAETTPQDLVSDFDIKVRESSAVS
ncbi:MAG: DNA-binding LacI/PurR family transcriptional regulator [Rhodoglobus sp.]|jgi:DNA-binding LacI/PurR family transcriptional regulator|nr:DNA-binding LacI/PurR family transcriptional regulator [Rhodoglobus sp.]